MPKQHHINTINKRKAIWHHHSPALFQEKDLNNPSEFDIKNDFINILENLKEEMNKSLK